MGKMLIVRKRADRSGEPPPPGAPWPLAGVEIVEGPDECRAPTTWVNRATAEGWIELEGAFIVMRPGGPAHDPMGVIHHFIHADAVVIHTVDGPVRYLVTHQPDKYVADGDDDTPMTFEHYAAGNSRVDWFYGLRREA